MSGFDDSNVHNRQARVPAFDRASLEPALLLGGGAALCWLLLPRLDMMAARPVAFLAAWMVMMAAMMLPSVAPLVTVWRVRGGRLRLLGGYLLVWAAAGLPVYGLSRAVDLMNVPVIVCALVLAAAGAYQLTPLKDVCLRTCRSPLDFLVVRWGRGPLRLGVDHGVYCLGCCWALMAVLVVAATMNLAVAGAVAALVFAEKVLPGGRWTARAVGLALLATAVVVVIV